MARDDERTHRSIANLRGGAPEIIKAFAGLAQAALAGEALDGKTKELISLGIAVAVRCDDCIGFHVKAALEQGVSQDEVIETLGMAIYMGAGPSVMYANHALEAFRQYKDQDGKASVTARHRRGDLIMSYTLDQFAADCRAALRKDPGPAGRELVRQYTARASTDPDFVAKYLGPDAEADRKILYEDPDLHFCILAHVYRGAKNSPPHDHGPSWAVYSQVAGVTEMTDWRLVQMPENGQPGKVEKVSTYALTPGVAHLYNEGDLHSPRREGETRLIRIEGRDLTKVKRDKFEIAA